MNTPIVSVCMICYNQEKYISQAIEGVLMQKTNFPIQLVIGEDCSTDGTWAICRDYADKNPDRIKLLPSVKNLGPMNNFLRTLDSCDGKYIAICEGDDYWIDSMKLQRQVNFMNANPDFSYCFHDSLILKQSTGETSIRIGNSEIDEEVDLKSLIIQKNISTASLLFRNKLLDFNNMPDWYLKIFQGDYGLMVLLAEKGLGKFLPEAMSVYRIHDGGIWNGSSADKCYMADENFYGILMEVYKKNEEVLDTVRKKMNFMQFNWGINLIRRGHFVKGLRKVLANYSSKQDHRLPMNIGKLPGAIKDGILFSKNKEEKPRI